MKKTYYFFTDKSFTHRDFESDEKAIEAAKADTAVIRVMRQADSQDIYKLEAGK